MSSTYLVIGYNDSDGLFLSDYYSMLEDTNEYTGIGVYNYVGSHFTVKEMLKEFEWDVVHKKFDATAYYVYPKEVTLDELNAILSKHGASIIR